MNCKPSKSKNWVSNRFIIVFVHKRFFVYFTDKNILLIKIDLNLKALHLH